VGRHDESERFAFAGAMLVKGFRGKRMELAVVDILCKGAIPALCVKLIEPGAKLAKLWFG
jgi:hypothetical protein